MLAHVSGADDGLRTERRYVRSVLPRAVFRDLMAGVRGRSEGFAQAAAIVVGLAITTGAYVCTLAGLRRSADKSVPRTPR
jgi:hypothetical protein